MTGVLLGLLNIGLLLVARRLCVRRPLDVVDCYLGLVGVLLVARPLVLAVGLDEPFPTYLFPTGSVGGLLVRTQLLVSGWIVMSVVGVAIGSRVAGTGAWLPGGRRPFDEGQLTLAAIGLTGLAAVVTVPLWVRYGGPTGLAQAFKLDHEIGSSYLRLPSLVGSLFATAAVLVTLHNGSSRRRLRGRRALSLALLVASGYLSYSWGVRDAPVMSLLALVLGAHHFHLYPKTRQGRIAVGMVLVLALTFGLRVARDLAIHDEVTSSIEDEPLIRQVSVGANLTMFDSLALVVRDWPSQHPYHGGDDFADAILGPLPLVGGPAADIAPSVAVQVAQTYEPLRVNGWPISPLGDWYINFGLPGVATGAALSGLAFGCLQVRMRRFTESPLLFVIGIFVSAKVLQAGIWAKSPSVGWQLTVVLLLSVHTARLLPRLGTRPRLAPARPGLAPAPLAGGAEGR